MKYEGNKIVYEVGDWVCALVDNVSFSKLGTDIPMRIVHPEPQHSMELTNSYCVDSKTIRPATQEEIDKVEDKIMVGEYEVEFLHREACLPHAIKVGCVTVTQDTFNKIGKKAGWL